LTIASPASVCYNLLGMRKGFGTKSKIVLHLYYVEELRASEIARILGISRQAVHQVIQKRIIRECEKLTKLRRFRTLSDQCRKEIAQLIKKTGRKTPTNV